MVRDVKWWWSDEQTGDLQGRAMRYGLEGKRGERGSAAHIPDGRGVKEPACSGVGGTGRFEAPALGQSSVAAS